MEEMLILVDRSDTVVGYAPRRECHAGDGKLHRAIALLLFNREGNILLQRRRSLLWDDVWDITAATHPLHHSQYDESYEDASQRCLQSEWNIASSVERVLSFVYFERLREFCEHEYCVLLAGRYDGPARFNPAHAYDMRWVSFATCQLEIRQNPSEYTPWARIALEQLRAHPLAKRLMPQRLP
jgi:isopentenyl-diphosphate delta-isomerase